MYICCVSVYHEPYPQKQYHSKCEIRTNTMAKIEMIIFLFTKILCHRDARSLFSFGFMLADNAACQLPTTTLHNMALTP